MSLNKKSVKKDKKSDFISKLLDMMEKFPKNIHWGEKDNELIIDFPNEVENQILPNYFRHNNFASFIRQLNMYGFCKYQKSEQQLKFSHKIFKRGNQGYFRLIKRKSKNNVSESDIINMNNTKQCSYSLQQGEHKLAGNQKRILNELLSTKNSIQSCLRAIEIGLDNLLKQIQKQSGQVKQLEQQIKNEFFEDLQNKLAKAQFIDFLLMQQPKQSQNDLRKTNQNMSVGDCSIQQSLVQQQSQEKHDMKLEQYEIKNLQFDDIFGLQQVQELSSLY